MIKIIEDDSLKDEWDKIANHPLQSWEWGEVRKKTGVEVVRIGVYESDKLVEVFQMTLHKVPKTHYQIGYIPRSILPKKEVLDFLKGYGKKNNLISIKFEPYEEKKESNNLTIKQFDDFTLSPNQLFPDWTIILDISKSEEELLKNMKPKTRYNIRLAEKKGVIVKKLQGKGAFEVFSKLYFETTNRQKYFGHDLAYHSTVWEKLNEHIAHILVAYYENQPLAAYELFLFKDIAYYPYGGSSLEFKQVMAPNLLMWEAIKFAKKNGAKSFDMWGASAPDAPENDNYAGFTRFKTGYGGKFKRMIGSYDLVINPLLYKLYNFIYKLRSVYLSLSFQSG